jgi:predicted transcriptional regulator
MERPYIQELIRTDYEQLFAFKVVDLVKMRKKLRVRQYELARVAECSLRKIQLFENHKCFDAYLLYVYKIVLSIEK